MRLDEAVMMQIICLKAEERSCKTNDIHPGSQHKDLRELLCISYLSPSLGPLLELNFLFFILFYLFYLPFANQWKAAE